MHDALSQVRGFLAAWGLEASLFSLLGFALGLFFVARLVSEKRAPANTFAWMLVILFLPWVGVPLYLLIGGRKLRRVRERKGTVRPVVPPACVVDPSAVSSSSAQTMFAAGGPPPCTGNRLNLLANGEEAYAELERRIREARAQIHIATFILGRDDTGRRLVRLLAQRAREGVRVRLLLDAVGSFLSGFDFVRPIRQAGGEVERFMPVLPFTPRGSANLRNHRKIAVFDRSSAIVGGHNLARVYMGPVHRARRWRDFGGVIEGPAAALLDDVFIADWCFATGEREADLTREVPAATGAAARGEACLQVVASGPDVPGDPLYEGMLAMVQEAAESVWVVTPYFIPDDVLLRSLIVKARAGRDVTVIVPRRSDHPITDLARRHHLRELQRAGARVLLHGPGMMHSKALIVDRRVALFGSANLDQRSLFVNFEIGVAVHSPAEVAAVRGWAEELARHCHPARPPRAARFPTSLAEDVSRLLAPLL